MTQEKTWNVANRLHSQKDSDNPEVNHIIAGADEIYDDAKGAKQSDINTLTDAALADRYTKAETYSKEQLDALITTPDANYVTVATFADLPQTGEANTIYRVSSYDGTQVDASKYALYAWNGTSYQLLAVRSAIGEVFDVSEYNSGATYETLTAALAAVPASVQRGGMSIKFILRTNTGTEEEPVYKDEYVQYRYMGISITTADFTNTSNWQGVNAEPTAGSRNLVESGGTDNRINLLPLKNSPLCIMTTTWDARNSHWTIPVVGGEKVEWHRTGNDNTLYFAYLTSYSSPDIGQTPSFLSGYEGRRTSSSSIVIPNGCKYFIINYLSDLSYLKINGYDILNGIWPIILKQVGNENIEDGAVSPQKLNQEFVEGINYIEQAAIKDSDLTIESTRTNNMANPANIMTGMISNTGAIRTDVTTWEMIKVDVTPGTVVSFGGFNLGRNGYAAFYNSDSSEKIEKFTLYYTEGVQQPVENKTVPEGATLLYISIKSPDSPTNPYSNLMVNVGANLLPYEPYIVGKITEIKGYEIQGTDPTLDGRVATLEEEVEELIEQGTTIPDIIADLPVSDGSSIQSGYAYIDSTTYIVKVKQ